MIRTYPMNPSDIKAGAFRPQMLEGAVVIGITTYEYWEGIKDGQDGEYLGDENDENMGDGNGNEAVRRVLPALITKEEPSNPREFRFFRVVKGTAELTGELEHAIYVGSVGCVDGAVFVVHIFDTMESTPRQLVDAVLARLGSQAG